MAWLALLAFRAKSPTWRPAADPASGFLQGLIGRRLSDLAGRGVDLVCPPRCLFCRIEAESAGDGGAVICAGCRRLLACDLVRCPNCGGPASDQQSCRGCRGRTDREQGIVVLGGYADDLRQAVLAAKRPSGELVVAGLAALLWEKHRDTLSAWRPDLVVPVPMHWTRRAARGTSAAQGLASRLAVSLGLPCRSALRRTRATRMQNELPPRERPANVQGVFRGSTAVAGRRVLLVDDVMTTGATLAACRAALTAAGAGAVLAAVVARADRGDPGTL